MTYTRTLLLMLAGFAVSAAGVAQQAPTTDPKVQQPNGATVPQVPRDMGPATPEGTPDPPRDDPSDTSRDDGTNSPETPRDSSETEPETARDISDTEPETARDISGGGPETARDISDRGPETARDISNRGPETARDISDRGPETARDTSGRGPETARDNGTPATEPEQGSQSRVAIAGESSGCWVKLYDSANFTGEDVTLVGDTSMPTLAGAFRSIEVGPNATVTTFGAENFGGSSRRFDPGLKVSENAEDVGSLRVTCPKPQAPPRG
jgi:hypothetical protein